MPYYAIVRRETDESLSVSLAETPPADTLYCRVSSPMERDNVLAILRKIEEDFARKGNWYQTYNRQIPLRNPKITREDIQTLRSSVEPRTSVLNFRTEEIEKNKAFADKLTADLGNKSAAQRRLGDWREADEQRVKVIHIANSGVTKSTLDKVKEDIKNGEVVKLGQIQNQDTGMSVFVGKKGLSDTLHYAVKYHDAVTANALYSVDTLIKNGILLDTVTLKEGENNNKQKNTAAMHELYSPFVFNNKPYIAKIAVECVLDNNNLKNQFYNLQRLKVLDLSEIKKPTSAQPVLPFSKSENSGHEQNNVDTISISQLFQKVKEFDKNFYTNSDKFSPAREDIIVENNQNRRLDTEIAGQKPFDSEEFKDLVKQKKAETKEILAELENGVKGIYTSEKYAQYLDTMSKFHDYSPNNTLMIFLQKPNASFIAGFEDWRKNFERTVDRGEKGIVILAPCSRKEPVFDERGNPLFAPNGEQIYENRITHYRRVTVFDVSQTSGKPLPEIARQLNGSVEDFNRFFAAVKAASPVPIVFENISGGVNGYFSHEKNLIAVQNDLSQLQTLKTTIHEIAHAVLHNRADGEEKGAGKRDREIQAESVAYVVCKRLGLDTSGYSFGYIAAWSADKDGSQLKNNLDVIKRTADQIISRIEPVLERNAPQNKVEKLENVPVKQSGNNIKSPTNGGTKPYSEIKNKAYINTGDLETTNNLTKQLEKASIGYSFAQRRNGKYSVTVEQKDFETAFNLYKKSAPKMSFDEILNRFANVKQLNSHQFAANCPCCNDKKQHLYIALDPRTDRVLLNCKKDCSPADITHAAGLKMADLFLSSNTPYQAPKIAPNKAEKDEISARNGEALADKASPARQGSALPLRDSGRGITENKSHGEVVNWRKYSYSNDNLNQKLLKTVGVHEDGHKFAIWRRFENGVWTNGLNGLKPTLFNAPALENSQKIYIVEGEKDVNTMVKMGLPCVCSPHGSKWGDFAHYFKGKDVVVITDNDVPGKKYGELITENIGETARNLRIIPAQSLHGGLKSGGDISDIAEALGADRTRDLILQNEREMSTPFPQKKIDFDSVSCENSANLHEEKTLNRGENYEHSEL